MCKDKVQTLVEQHKKLKVKKKNKLQIKKEDLISLQKPLKIKMLSQN